MVVPVIVSALITWVLLFPARAALRRAGIVDQPNARSSHTTPTVRGGGVVIVITVCASLIYAALTGDIAAGIGPNPWQLIALLLAVSTLAVVSFVDDLRGLPARVRFTVQVSVALAAVLLLGRPQLSVAAVTLALVGLVWIAGYTNAFNFMDGINGIAGIQALTSGLGTALVAQKLGLAWGSPLVIIALAIAGAALGFLPHNFPRAKVFMGDVSSASLGFMLAALAFGIAVATSWWVLFWIGLLHTNFVLDTGITLVRRAWRGDRLSQAHREHLYQRLIRAGRSHTFVSLWQGGLQVMAISAVVLATLSSATIKALVVVFVVGLWLCFFGFAERAFRRSAGGQGSGGG